MQKDQKLCDASDMVFSKNDCNDEIKEIVTIYVMAPVLYQYVAWVIKDALIHNRKRLYFLARDGYSMCQMAQRICEIMRIDIECCYLYCSRYSLRSAQYKLLGKDSLGYICLGGIEVTFEKIMHRSGFDSAESERIRRLIGYTKSIKQPVSYGELFEIRTKLAGCEKYLKVLENKSKKAYPIVCNYLLQEGLLDDVSYAIVDSGWTGSMQKTMQHLLSSMGYNKKLTGYYFGMFEYPKDADISVYNSFFFGPKDHMRRKVYFSNSLFECIFSSPEGMTVGYECLDNRYIPVFEKEKNPNYEKIVYSTDLLCQYAEYMASHYSEDLYRRNGSAKISEALLKQFMGKPTRLEVNEYGKYIFCDDVIGEKNQIIAAELSKEEIKGNYLFAKSLQMIRKRGKTIKESAWLEGSAVWIEGNSKYRLMHCAVSKYALYVRKRIKMK